MDELDRRIAALLLRLGPEASTIVPTVMVCAVSTVLGIGSMWQSPDLSITQQVSGSATGAASVAVAGLDGTEIHYDDADAIEGDRNARARAPAVPLDHLDLRLVGTAVHVTPSRSAAVLRQGDGSVARMHHLGDVVQGYRLEAIESKRVRLLSPTGERWQLEVSHRTDAEPTARLEDTSPQPPESPADTLTLPRRVFGRLLRRGLGPSRALQARLDDAQRVTGYTLEVRPGSVPHRMGLEGGDVLVSVEGLAPPELDDPNEALRAMADRQEVCLGIERGGVVIPLCYRSE